MQEYGLRISRAKYKKKLKSFIYYEKRYNFENSTIKELRISYKFGKLEDQVKHQLFSILKQRNHVDTTQTIIVHYKDSLKAKNKFPQKDRIVTFEGGSHEYQISYNSFVYSDIQCKLRYKKTNQFIIFLEPMMATP
ncbi:MAG: hypothetical protein COC08_07465 [Maribacter sp.]|nr:MAG: hypothetical protein COC08_07465 [Maribacter sp.]